MNSLEIDMRELSDMEIALIAGGGFFEKVGEMLDNPWTTAGKAADWVIKNAGGSLEGAWATGKIG